jgi:hypothetical protein
MSLYSGPLYDINSTLHRHVKYQFSTAHRHFNVSLRFILAAAMVVASEASSANRNRRFVALHAARAYDVATFSSLRP